MKARPTGDLFDNQAVCWITGSSKVLDAEVQKMIERAQPLPAMPDTKDNSTLELVVPVQFFLR